MTKAAIIERLSSGDYPMDKILGWVKALPGSSKSFSPTTPKVGDVFMHKIFLHPYVLLERKNDYWVCGLLTSEPSCDEILCETNSRFFTGSYFTRALFTVIVPTGSFYGVHDNKRHLTSVLKKLKKIIM